MCWRIVEKMNEQYAAVDATKGAQNEIRTIRREINK
jgi:hypothetical protein